MLTGSGSTYRMRKCKAMDRQMAPTSHGFDQGGIFKRDWFSDRLGSSGKVINPYFTVRLQPYTTSNGGGACGYGALPPFYLFKALHISMVTRTDRAMVIG